MKTIIFSLILSFTSQAAIQAGMQWDVKTTGADTNGGGFDPTVAAPGTDESLVNAGTAYVDVVIGADTTQGSSILQPFTATTHGPGNVLIISGGAGCTTGRFEMLSQSGGIATFDRSLGTAGSVCTGVLGGCLLTLATATATTTSVTLNTINVQSGTYAGGFVILDPYNTATLYFSGYGTSHGDMGSQPLITTSANTRLVQTNNNTTYWNNFSFSNTGATRNDGFFAYGNERLYLYDCTLDGFNYGIRGDNGIPGYYATLWIERTEVKNSISGGVWNAGSSVFISSWVHNNGGFGYLHQPGSGTSDIMLNTIFSGNSGTGAASNSCGIWNSVFAYNAGDGLDCASIQTIRNSVFYGNTGYGVNSGTVYGTYLSTMFTGFNAFGANSTAPRHQLGAGLNDVTLTADPFVSTSNFALNATAGGGALLTHAGFPGVFPGGLSTGYLDIGAVQSAGGSSTATQHAYPGR